MPVTVDDIVINQNTYKDILKSVHFGYNFAEDNRKLSILRGRIVKWDSLNLEQKRKAKNDFIIVTNVFDEKQIVRFLLSNLDETHWETIVSLAVSAGKHTIVYPNINGVDVNVIKYINNDIIEIL